MSALPPLLEVKRTQSDRGAGAIWLTGIGVLPDTPRWGCSGTPRLPPERAGWQTSAMLQAIGAIVFVVLAYTVLMLAAGQLSPSYAAGVAFLAPLVGLVAAWWAFSPGRRRQP
jgi:drug/metabolite transporter (DMT)-like permease